MIHKDCEDPLKSWYREVQIANWATPNELKYDFPSASILGKDRVVFNIKGNKCRLIVKVNYAYKIIWIRFIGTHSEYDKIDVGNI